MEWLKDAIFYEIYPQSFADSNGDGIGDFKGIIEHLDYIKDLGCNAIWMNPCYASPFLDAGYDVSDYKLAAPRYGTNEDLKALFTEVHKRGMHILLDLVPGHTSWEHEWFKKSLEPEKNQYSGRYVWTDSAWKDLENVEGITGSLRGYSQRDGSCAVNFYTHQPSLNYGFYEIKDPAYQQPMDSPDALATREAIKDVMRFWLDMGCDGFRVDMAGSLVKNDPAQKGTIALWQDVREFLNKEYPKAAMVSEWGQPDRSLAGGFHMDFMLHFGPSHYVDLFHEKNPFFAKEGKGDAKAFIDYYLSCYTPTQGKGMICIPSGNHDMERMSYFVDDMGGRLAFAFLFTMPGAPFIYYGDEIGMKYLAGITSVEGGYNRTGARSPMQWDDSKNAGFSTGDAKNLYVMIDPDENRPTVKKALADKTSLYYTVKELIEVRQSHKALQSEGGVEFVYVKDHTYPLAYRRLSGDEKIMIVLNPSGKEVSFKYDKTPGEVLYTIGEPFGYDSSSATLTMKGQSGVIFKES